MKGIKMDNLTKLRYWTFKILPLVYDDSLSYYEVLAKVTAKVNELVDSNNAMPQTITDEITKQLDESYATNINNKINKLANEVYAKLITAIATDEGTNTFTKDAKSGGELIFLNNTLYKVTAVMPAGTNYIVGTNIIPINISEELKTIKETYISSNNEHWNERSTNNYNAGIYLFWKDILYITTKDIHTNDILYADSDNQNLKQVTLASEIINIQKQIYKNDNDIDNLQKNLAQETSRATNRENFIDERISNIVAQSGNDNTEIVDARVKADGTSATTAGNAIREQITELKDDISDLQSAVIIEKNLVTEFVSGKYVTTSSNKIAFVDDERYNYAVVNARRITAFSSTRYFSNNFSFFAKKDGTSLGKITSDYRIGTEGNVYSVPSGTEVIYLCSGNVSSDIVVVSGKTVINANDYSTTDYPYDTVYKTTIPTLWVNSADKTLEELADDITPPYYNNIRDELDNLITEYRTFGPASLSDNVVTVTGAGGGFCTNQFVSNSNLVRITGNITFTTPNLYWQLAYYDGTRWNYQKKTAIKSGVDFEVSFDAANLVVYNSAENFYIIFNTIPEEGISDYTGTIIANKLSINSLSSFQQSEYYDEDFEPMMQKVFAKLDEGGDSAQTETTFELTGVNGEKYIVGLGESNSIVFIPKIPGKTLFCGNSLLLGMNTSSSNHQYVYGMCATAPENDYCHKVMSAIEAEKASATYDRVHGASFEQLGTSDSFSTLWNTTANVYTGKPLKDSFTADLDLIVIQLGDNVNSEDKRTAFANNIDQFIQNIRTASPNARLLWVYGWFNNSIVQNTIETACKKWGIEKVNINSLHTTTNEGVSGQSYITGTGGTDTVSNKWITHPGDNGMTAIANKIIEVLGI